MDLSLTDLEQKYGPLYTFSKEIDADISPSHRSYGQQQPPTSSPL